MPGDEGLSSTFAADPSSPGLSLVRRIANHFRSGIVEGQYRVGTRLPTVRHVAAQVGTTAETVAAAYRILSEQGLVRARTGIGTVVLPQAGGDSEAGLATPAAGRVLIVPPLATPSFHETYRRLLHLDRETASGGFASYAPALDLYPREAGRLLRSALRRDGARLFEMGSAEGDPALRGVLAERLAVGGAPVNRNRMVITNGGQEGLALVFRALAGPGDAVVVESPTYLGALDALATAGVRVVGVPVGPDGPDPDELASVATRARARVFYTMPSFQNPTGYTMSPARRRRLLAVARRHDLVIVEDAAASDLSWGAPPPPSLLALDREQRVVYVGTFSKSLFSGIRLGFVAAPEALVEPLLRLKYVTNVHVSLLLQRLGLALASDRRMRRHLAWVRPAYRARRDAMVATLARELNGAASWTAPEGGFSLWLELPRGLDAADLFRLAVERGVSFVPGAVFFPEAVQHHALRLCFSGMAPGQITRGVGLLGEALRELSGRSAPARGRRRA
jgi:GntR family transcriptional regulator/MocR family aminotransferase